MTDCTALSKPTGTFWLPAEIDLDALPARLSKRLWVTPAEFLQTTNAWQIARWAVSVSPSGHPSLPEPSRRGPKIRYADESIWMLAYIQAAWRMGYEMVVDYFRSHPQAAGFTNGYVISIGQYWERRQALGIWTFWLFFVGMVWQLLRAQIIHGAVNQRKSSRRKIRKNKNAGNLCMHELGKYGSILSSDISGYDYFLIRDMDQAGADWVEMITTALREKKRRYTVLFPPGGLDPDEAFLSGWWPPIIS